MKSPTELSLGGFVPMSTVDWPDQLAATVFTRGCPWDCPYCHNPHLLASAGANSASTGAPVPAVPSWSEVLDFLTQRVGLLDGVVFSGGEPCAQTALLAAAEQVRALGLAVGLHTAGSVPSVFEAVLPQVAWVGFDVKAPFADYARITRVAGSGERAQASLRVLVASGVDFEVRTTLHPDLLTSDDLLRLADELESEGVRRWAIQSYRPEGTRPGLLAEAVFTTDMLAPGLTDRFELAVR